MMGSLMSDEGPPFTLSRCPLSSNYAEIAEEVEALTTNPPPPQKVVLPDPEPWMAVSLSVMRDL